MVEADLVPFAERHVSDRAQWLTHPEVRVGVPIQGEISEQSTLAWARRVAQDETRVDFVTEDMGGQARVMCGITGIDLDARRGELYMFAEPGSQGKGYGSLTLNQLCAWAFGPGGLNRIFLYTMGSNEGARRFYERAGFVEEGVLREHAMHHGRIENRHIHGMLAADWARRGSH